VLIKIVKTQKFGVEIK